MCQKLVGWKTKVLSQAGRTVLLRAKATALPQYQMSSFLIPKTWCDKLDKLLKNFWWCFGNGSTHRFTLMAWSRICLSKERGGVGLRYIFYVNQALLARLGWRLLQNLTQLWVKILQEKYFCNSIFMSTGGSNNSSWTWQGLSQVRSLIQSSVGFVPRNG